MDNIYEVLKRYEFNKTEAETLHELVQKAIEKGAAAQKELNTLSRAAQILTPICVEMGLIAHRPLPPTTSDIPPLVGIDGSNQQVGGFGGKWYVPVSCAIVKALNGSIADLEVEVTANIEEIQQREFDKVDADVSKVMMTIETKAISNWSNRAPTNSYIFLDGPIIDPPNESNKEYVNLRSAALKACLAKKIQVIGCVKRSFDVSLKQHVDKTIKSKDDKLSSLVELFPSDSHLLVFLLSALAKNTPSSNYLHTKVLQLRETPVTKMYLEQGVRILFSYLQRDISTSLLRVEVLIPAELEEHGIQDYVHSILDLTTSITYPGHYVPLPVQMAHEKCNIREGCAEVLFEEIMTRARATDPLEQIVLSKLR